MSEEAVIAKERERLNEAILSVGKTYGYQNSDYAIKECLGYGLYHFHKGGEAYPKTLDEIRRSLDCVQNLDKKTVTKTDKYWRDYSEDWFNTLNAAQDIKKIEQKYMEFFDVKASAHPDAKRAKNNYRKLQFCRINPDYRTQNEPKLWKINEEKDNLVVMTCVNEVNIEDVKALFPIRFSSD